MIRGGLFAAALCALGVAVGAGFGSLRRSSFRPPSTSPPVPRRRSSQNTSGRSASNLRRPGVSGILRSLIACSTRNLGPATSSACKRAM